MFIHIALLLLVQLVMASLAKPIELINSNHDHEFDAYPKYEFSYGVNDPSTGDEKEHHEERDGDMVRGHYSLVEPDGGRRIVEYTVDAARGFNAVVRRIAPEAHAPIVAHHLPLIAHHHHHHPHADDQHEQHPYATLIAATDADANHRLFDEDEAHELPLLLPTPVIYAPAGSAVVH